VANASASTGAVVSVIGCLGEEGETTVPSGEPITIEGIGDAQGSYGLIENFLIKQHTTLTVSNATETVYDLSGDWGAPQPLTRRLWVTRLPDTELGIALAPGEAIRATYDISFAQPLLVAFPPVGSSGENGPFLIREDGPLSCLITGS
jgi:hypothetical protein